MLIILSIEFDGDNDDDDGGCDCSLVVVVVVMIEWIYEVKKLWRKLYLFQLESLLFSLLIVNCYIKFFG